MKKTSIDFHELSLVPLDAHRDGGKGSDLADLLIPAFAPIDGADGITRFEPGMLEIQSFRKTCFVKLPHYRVRRVYRVLREVLGSVALWTSILLIISVVLFVLAYGNPLSARTADGAPTTIWQFPPFRLTAIVLGLSFAGLGLVTTGRRLDYRALEETPVNMPSEIIVPVRKWLKEAKKPVEDEFKSSSGAQAAGGEGEVVVETFRSAMHTWRLEAARKERGAVIRLCVAEAIHAAHLDVTGKMPLAVSESVFAQGTLLQVDETGVYPLDAGIEWR